jgi:23S rRNA pseudouridine1911/1915/1917 synthase
MRLDLFLASALTQYSRSRLQQLIIQGFVRLNGQSVRARQIIRPGDHVEVTEPPPGKTGNAPEDIPLEILFEDAALLVLNKPPGLVVHPGAGHREHTLVNALLHHCRGLSRIGGEERPGIVHRLDKDTSGCLVVALNDEAHRALSAQFASRVVEKVYLAIVSGQLRKKQGVIEAAIARHPVHRQRMTTVNSRGRAASTEYKVVREATQASLVECRIHSGRTHQIRVHFHHLGHPVQGDRVYGAKGVRILPRQMLHAWKLGFSHPRTGEWKSFEAPLPEDFKAALQSLGL